MASWMKERDRLLEQTLAFVQGVAAQRKVPAVDPVRSKSANVETDSAIQSDTIQPDTIQPDTIQPDTIQPDAIQPDAIQFDAIQPDTFQATAIEEIAIQPTAVSDPKNGVDGSAETEALIAMMASSQLPAPLVDVVNPVAAVILDVLGSRRMAVAPAIHSPVVKKPPMIALPERDVIATRVARFRAGQQKLLQDREDSYIATQARIRETLKSDPSA